MKTTHESKKWYGFTEDRVFGWVMQDKEFCKYILQVILPDIKIKSLKVLQTQKKIRSKSRDEKDVILDLYVKDDQNRAFNVEMQVANHHNLGERIEWYLYKLHEQAQSLKKHEDYEKLDPAYVIFLCDFDYFSKGRIRYSFHTYEDNDKSLMLPDRVSKVIINAKGKLKGNSAGLQGLVKLMRGEPVKLNKYFDYAQDKIKEVNEDPTRRAEIMEYEAKLMEREEIGVEKGTKIGEKQGEEISIRKMVKSYQKHGFPESEIKEEIFANFHDNFTPEELNKLIQKGLHS